MPYIYSSCCQSVYVERGWGREEGLSGERRGPRGEGRGGREEGRGEREEKLVILHSNLISRQNLLENTRPCTTTASRRTKKYLSAKTTC